MQPILRKIDTIDESSFVTRIDELSQFYNKWHYHPEIEITHVVRGQGNRFVGDSIDYFEEGDLVFLDSNIPHVWKSNRPDKKSEGNTAIANVIQFNKEFLSDSITNLTEFDNINQLWKKAALGLKIFGETKESVIRLMNQIFETDNNMIKLCRVLQILETIALSKETQPLCSLGFMEAYQKSETNRLDSVYEFTLDQYYRKILIDEVASVANMSVPNFCKYFKSRTQKTYIQFLNEVRIGIACKMLIENKASIQQIAFDCGFHNLSNFNRNFKMIKGTRPLEFRNKYFV